MDLGESLHVVNGIGRFRVQLQLLPLVLATFYAGAGVQGAFTALSAMSVCLPLSSVWPLSVSSTLFSVARFFNRSLGRSKHSAPSSGASRCESGSTTTFSTCSTLRLLCVLHSSSLLALFLHSSSCPLRALLSSSRSRSSRALSSSHAFLSLLCSRVLSTSALPSCSFLIASFVCSCCSLSS